MFIKQLYTGCISEAAYYIEDNGIAAVIDPLRDTTIYTDLAQERKASIRYIFETHIHADFISGHLDLQQATGAPIVFGPGTTAGYEIKVAADGDIFQIGSLTLEVLHTPGHTPESVCYLLKEATGKPYCVFTGDTLFVGDVGRPDLAQQDQATGTEALAAMLYHSLQQKIVPLPDDVIVYPAHGPGSACGKNLGPATFSTIGEEKEHNYALQAADEAAFVKKVTEGLAAPPPYFPINAKVNQEGYDALQQIISRSMQALDPATFASLYTEDTIVLDTRPADIFMQGFIPGSVFIGLEGRFAEWAGSLLSYQQPILLVTSPGKEEETIIRLARVGFEKVAGYLSGGFEAWLEGGRAIDMLIDVEPDELMMDLKFDQNLVVVDVRNAPEYAEGHLKDAVNIPLAELSDPASMAHMEETQNIYIHCAGGYRSIIASSLIKRQGIHNIRNVRGGWNLIKEQENVPVAKEKNVLN